MKAESSQWLRRRLSIAWFQSNPVYRPHGTTVNLNYFRRKTENMSVCAIHDCLNPIFLGSVLSYLLFNRFFKVLTINWLCWKKHMTLESNVFTIHGCLNPIVLGGVLPELLFKQFCFKFYSSTVCAWKKDMALEGNVFTLHDCLNPTFFGGIPAELWFNQFLRVPCITNCLHVKERDGFRKQCF